MKKIRNLFVNSAWKKTTTVVCLFVMFLCGLPQWAQADLIGFCGWPVTVEDAEAAENEKCEENPDCCDKSPCSVAKGNYTTSVVDLQIPTRGFPLAINRRYKTDRSIDGFFGFGWTSNLLSRLTYTTYLYAAPSTYLKQAAIIMPQGGIYKFNENPDGTFAPPPGSFDTLVKNVDGTFDLTLKLSRNKFHFNSEGALISVTDAYNNALSFSYDGGTGRLSQISDASGSGRSLSFTYNPTGQIELIEDHSGRQIEYQYTSSKLTRVIDPDNRNTDYGYVQGRFAPLLSQIKDNWGRIITDVTYDSADRVSTYTEAGEVWTYTYRYQDDPHKTSKTDSSGNRWVFTFNDDGQVIQTDPPAGSGSASSYVAYNSNGLVEYSIDETGVKTFYTYNTNGSIATITRDDGGPNAVRFDYSYDPNFPEKVISIIPKDPSTGNTDLDWQGQKFDYYQSGSAAPGTLYHVYRFQDDGTTLDTLSTFGYSSAGQLLNSTSPTGAMTTYGYDPTTGDLTSITYPKNSLTGSNPVYNYGRDSLGRLTSVTNPLGKTTSFTYDDLDRILTVTLPKPTPSSPLSFVTTYTYDVYDASSSLVFTQKVDSNNKATKQGYDQYGHLVKSIDALNSATIFSYNKGLLISITDANDNITNYISNELRQLEAAEFPEGTLETYTYWEDGQLKSKTDRKNQTINYSYDHLKRLAQKSYPNSTSITFTFVGQKLANVNDTVTGETHSYGYDLSYRVSSNTQGSRGVINYTYDAADRINTYSVSGGGPTATYAYYDDGSLKTIDWSPVTGTFIYNYALDSKYSSITFPNGQHRDYAFDDQGRLTQIANVHPTAGNLATYDYGYDFNHSTGQLTILGQRTSMFSTVPSQGFSNHETKYYYDANYQLTRSNYPNVAPFNSEVHEWTYDPIGNRVTNAVNGVPQSYTYYENPGNSNNGQRLESDGANSYTYDENGNMISKSGPDGNFIFSYDYENRLTEISGSATATFTYDFVGRRISGTDVETTNYLYNGRDLIAERSSINIDYIFGQSIDEPLAMAQNNDVFYFSIDALKSVILLTDVAGSVQNKYLFDVWGVIRSQTASIFNIFGYTSREFSSASLISYRFRFYQPTIGRFTSEDPIRFSAGINFYSYVENNPTLFNDPWGLYKTGDVILRTDPKNPGSKDIVIVYQDDTPENNNDGNEIIITIGRSGDCGNPEKCKGAHKTNISNPDTDPYSRWDVTKSFSPEFPPTTEVLDQRLNEIQNIPWSNDKYQCYNMANDLLGLPQRLIPGLEYPWFQERDVDWWESQMEPVE